MATTVYSGPMLEGLNRANIANREADIREQEAGQRYLLGLLSERNRSQLGNRGIDLNAMLGRQQYDVGMAGVGAQNRATDVRQQLGLADIERLLQTAAAADRLARDQMGNRVNETIAGLELERRKLDENSRLKGRELEILAQQGALGGLPPAVLNQLMRQDQAAEQEASIAEEIARRANQAAEADMTARSSEGWFNFGTDPAKGRRMAASDAAYRQKVIDAVNAMLSSMSPEDAALVQIDPRWNPGNPGSLPVVPRGRTRQSRLNQLIPGFDPARIPLQ